MFAVNFTVTNNNPNTVWNKLAARLGREPSNAEVTFEMQRILTEAREERRAAK